MNRRGYPVAPTTPLWRCSAPAAASKTFGTRGRQAMNWGWLTAIFTGLFGPATAQSWKIKEGFDHEW
jgi:hypothetical protein